MDSRAKFKTQFYNKVSIHSTVLRFNSISWTDADMFEKSNGRFALEIAGNGEPLPA